MKILVINFHGLEFPGGVQSIINTLLRETKENYRVLCSGEKEEKTKIEGVLEYKSPLLIKNTKKELEIYLQKIWVDFLPELIYCHNLSYMFESKNAKIIFDFFKKKGCVMVEHTHHAYVRRKQRCKKALNFDWDKVVVVSKYAYKKISPLIKNKKVIEIVPNSINLKDFSPKRIASVKKKRISKEFCFIFPSRVIRLSTGEIGEQKQFLTTIKALSKLKKCYHKKFNLIIPHLGVSGKSHKGQISLEQKLRKHNILNETIIYPKTLLQKDMIEFYAQGDVVLFPSLEESFGLVTIEAQACGLPVIVANSGASSELVKNNYNGLIVKPKSVNELCEAMKQLIDNNKLYKELAKNGLKTAKQYSSKKQAKKITKIFNSFQPKKRIFLVRHSQTDFNKRGLFSGQIETKLTSKGIKQAEKIKEFFYDKKIDKIYCSPLERTKKTAKIIFGNKKFIYSDLLKEIDVGFCGGKTNKQVKNEFPKIKRKNGSIISYPGGESHHDLKKRISSFLKNPKEREIAIVAHESVNRMILSLFLKKEFYEVPRHKNNEVVIINQKSFEKIVF